MSQLYTRKAFVVSTLTLALSTIPLLSGCAKALSGDGSLSSGNYQDVDLETAQDWQNETLFIFDTVVELSAYCEKSLMSSIVEKCRYFDGKFSRTNKESDVGRINAAQGNAVEVCEDTAKLITAALDYAQESQGLFDITIGSVSSLWDFASGIKPKETSIKEALRHVDYRKVRVDGNMVTLEDPLAQIDLGGIAKGYIADSLAQSFVYGGCETAMINLGGNVFALGKKPDGSAWSIGVKDPNDKGSSAIASIRGANLSVVTSGLYERSFTLEGRNYHHILDPKTGFPVESNLASSSVVSPRSIDGDAYSTILFLLGQEKASELLEKDDRFEGFLVNVDGTVVASKNSHFSFETS